MLNVFYWYSAIWGVVLILYSLGLSDYCISLDSGLLLFLISSILVSFIMGTLLKKHFVYQELYYDNSHHQFSWFIIILGVVEFIYSNDIPLISIVLKSTQYGSFSGIPIVHTILENLIIYDSAYLIYVYMETKKKCVLLKSFLLVLILLLMFHKGAVIYCIFVFLNLFIAKLKYKKRLKMRNMIALLAIITFIFYINGVLTNLRSGYTWNSPELIMGLGKLNERWPGWLSPLFGWGYVYIINPLANLNYNVMYSYNHEFIKLIMSVIPTFISKRLFRHVAFLNDSLLLNDVLNASTGFIESVTSYGATGLYFYYIYFSLIIFIIVKQHDKKNSIFKTVNESVLSMMTVFLFFYNTLRMSATSLLPFIIIVNILRAYKRQRFCIRRQLKRIGRKV